MLVRNSTAIVFHKLIIIVGKFDPLYLSTRQHFEMLFERYGAKVICLDLLNKKEKHPRESLLGNNYRECLAYLESQIPQDKKLLYVGWDFRGTAKKYV